MRAVVCIAAAALFMTALLASAPVADAKVSDCLVCTLIAGILQQMAIEQNTDIKTAINNMCTDITEDLPFLKDVCEIAADIFFQTTLQTCVNDGTSPDNCCVKVKMCESTNTCVLFKHWPPATAMVERHHGSNSHPFVEYLNAGGDVQDLPAGAVTPHLPMLAQLARWMSGDTPIPVADHLPLVDLDGDRFSTIGPLRGFHWRGKDCDDLNADVYPGRATAPADPSVDHNCNGISGTNSAGESYEDLFCKGTEQRGIISLGDSVTAHFGIPDFWFRPKYINSTTYTNLLAVLEDEADWPHCSWGTGFAPESMCRYSKLQVASLQGMLRANNLCNHRDYQNIGVNGARTGSMAPPNGIVTTIHNRTGTDQPATVIYALVGNDVCNGHAGFQDMTTPADFEANVLAAMNYLDSALAPNSHVLFVGLADGRILFDTLQNETHPIGVPYPDFYDYLNCWGTSPCWGWMNTNETVRDLTWSEHANVLNNVYPKIIAENTFQNFDMGYIPPDFQMLISKWISMGGHARDLIEPVDGFHPSQTGDVLLAEQMWTYLQANFSQAIGPENPNNAAITAQFGDQGGFGL